MNVVNAAISDVNTASALLRSTRSGVNGLDVRHMAGGGAALKAGEDAFDVYCAALDACLRQRPALRARGYLLERAA